jgi:hypothetical protein
MTDELEQKEEEKARAKVEAGKQAQRWLDAREAEKSLAEANSLEAFKKLSPAARTEIYRTNPERYKQLAEQWREQAEADLLQRSGR